MRPRRSRGRRCRRRRPRTERTVATVRKQATTPVPASAFVPKTAAMLAGSTYLWVQPHWVLVDGVSLPTLPRTIRLSTITQPPAWIRIG